MKKIILSLCVLLSTQMNAADYTIDITTDSFFSDANCNKNVHHEQLKEFFNVCDTFELTLEEEEKYPVYYQLISKLKVQSSWTPYNVHSTIELPNNGLNITEVFELNTDLNAYAILACTFDNSCSFVNLEQASCTEDSCEIRYDIDFNKDNLPNTCN
jgi:hypothetical protein